MQDHNRQEGALTLHIGLLHVLQLDRGRPPGLLWYCQCCCLSTIILLLLLDVRQTTAVLSAACDKGKNAGSVCAGATPGGGPGRGNWSARSSQPGPPNNHRTHNISPGAAYRLIVVTSLQTCCKLIRTHFTSTRINYKEFDSSNQKGRILVTAAARLSHW